MTFTQGFEISQGPQIGLGSSEVHKEGQAEPVTVSNLGFIIRAPCWFMKRGQ